MGKRFGIGIIGFGRIGQLHAKHILEHSQFELIGYSDLYLPEAGITAGRNGRKLVRTTNYNELINHPEVEAVFVCSPTDTHIEVIKAAIAKGKHIFCEKPISFSYQATAELLELVSKSGVVFQLGFNRRFDHNFAKVRRLLEENKIGKPQLIKIISRDPSPPPAHYIASSGGMFMDMTIHDFDMARFIAGSEVVSVYAEGAVLVDDQIGELGDIDTALITLKFANGMIASIDNCRKAVYGYDQRLEVLGDQGALSADNEKLSTVSVLTSEAVKADLPKVFFLDRYIESYRSELDEFAQCLEQNRTPSVTLVDGYAAEKIAAAAALSLKEGRAVKIAELV